MVCALSSHELNWLSTSEMVKDVGTNQLKVSKINIFSHQYESLKMKTDESIKDIYTRFADFLNGLKSFGNSYTNIDLMNKTHYPNLGNRRWSQFSKPNNWRRCLLINYLNIPLPWRDAWRRSKQEEQINCFQSHKENRRRAWWWWHGTTHKEVQALGQQEWRWKKRRIKQSKRKVCDMLQLYETRRD